MAPCPRPHRHHPGSDRDGNALLAVLPEPVALLIGATMLPGAARGVFTLLQATALAPWAGAALAQALGGYAAVFALLAGLAGLTAGTGLTRSSPVSKY